MNAYQANFFAFSHQEVDYLFCRFGNRTHSNNYILCIGCAIIIERLITSACELCNFLHVGVYDIGNWLIEFIDSLFRLKENVRVLCGSSCNWMFRIEGISTELCKSLVINKILKVIHLDNFNLLNFM